MSVAFAGALVALTTSAMAGGDRRGSLKDDYRPFSWTGVYVGGQIGYLNGDADHAFSNGAPSDTSNPAGWLVGAHVGFNVQNGNIVFGAEADIERTDADGGFVNLTGGTSQGGVAFNWQGSIRGRLGVTSGAALFYLTAGWAFADIDFDGGPAGGPVCCGFSKSVNGWTVGGGGEWVIGKNMTARIEYRYTDFGDHTGALNPAFPGVNMNVDLVTHAVRAGVSFKF